jgi:acyl-CoA thioesterase-1
MKQARVMLRAVLAGLAMTAASSPQAHAAAFTVVAVGASNTSGWGVGEQAAYPARLEALLRERGLDVRVVNAGRPFDTTSGMLGRLDAAVPEGTQLVVLQPGGNDLRFFGTRERRTANIEAMVARLGERGIRVIVYDPVFSRESYQWDGIHINREGHARIAEDLAPQVIDVLQPPRPAAPKRGVKR